MLKTIALLLLAITVCYTAEGPLLENPPFACPSPLIPVQEEKKTTLYYFVSSQWLLIPGIGLSLRPEGYSIDLTGNTIFLYSTASLSGSKVFYFFQKPSSRQYVSVGTGGYLATLIYDDYLTGFVVPLRYGRESEYGFFDIGTGGLVYFPHKKPKFYGDIPEGYHSKFFPLLEVRLGGKF